MYTIGQVSEMFGIPVSTLRYYDKEGLFPSMERKNGIRRFGEAEVEALHVIECLKASGLEIRDIKQFMQWCSEGPATYEVRRELFERRREAVLEEMARLRMGVIQDRLRFLLGVRAHDRAIRFRLGKHMLRIFFQDVALRHHGFAGFFRRFLCGGDFFFRLGLQERDFRLGLCLRLGNLCREFALQLIPFFRRKLFFSSFLFRFFLRRGRRRSLDDDGIAPNGGFNDLRQSFLLPFRVRRRSRPCPPSCG